MLQSLLSKAKTHKTQPTTTHQPPILKPKLPSIVQPDIQLPNQHIQLNSIRRVRYFALEKGPDIRQEVLGCEISYFNQLTYAKRKVKEIDLRNEPFPCYLNHLRPLLQLQLPSYNHILINVYPAGIGIMPHFDGPLYRPKVVVLSLGGPSIINFSSDYKNEEKKCRILLEDQSIHIFQEESYTKCLHGIESYAIDSIFLRIELKEGKFEVLRCSVDNLQLTRLLPIIRQKMGSLYSQLESGEQIRGGMQSQNGFSEQMRGVVQSQIDVGEQVTSGWYLVGIGGNKDYNFKMEAVRGERISITIRQKYHY